MLRKTLWLLIVLLVVKTVVVTVLSYPGYFPPDFRVDFLLGRRAYFFGPYQVAFYTHILSGPASLVFGLVQMSEPFRQRFAAWHRRVGRWQVACVLLLVVPSGIWMAFRASTPVATWAFVTLSVLTAVTVVAGWRAAVAGRFAAHGRWMIRCFALLSSAVFLRVLGGAADVLGVEGTYPYAAWLGWLVPLLLVEAWLLTRRQSSPPPPR